jgi:hypothetical protein
LFYGHFYNELSTTQEVNRKLSAHIQRLSGDATFNKSSYGAEKDFELVVWKTDILASQIDAMLDVCVGQLAVFPVEAQPCSLAFFWVHVEKLCRFFS